MLIWIDVGTPKYALFFSKMIPHLKKRDFDIFVTTRYSEHYTEAKEILDLNNINYHILGNYGGSNLKDKFIARLERQKEIVELIDSIEQPTMLLTGAVVDSVQAAYGLGIPVVNIYDTPVTAFPNSPFDYKNLTAVSRLTLPYSTLFFYPFVLPKEMFDSIGLYEDQIIPYNFIDVCLWMDQIKVKKENDFRIKYNLDRSKKTILIREEEYKAHYVKDKLPVLYDLIYKLKDLDVNLVIMPRYEKNHLKRDFGKFATILEEKLKSEEFYPFIDMFIGGGGTMNLEAVYYGIPTISTRSIWLYHDKYLVENNLMHWTKSSDDAMVLVDKLLGTRIDSKQYFAKDGCGFKQIIDRIEEHFKGNLDDKIK